MDRVFVYIFSFSSWIIIIRTLFLATKFRVSHCDDFFVILNDNMELLIRAGSFNLCSNAHWSALADTGWALRANWAFGAR